MNDAERIARLEQRVEALLTRLDEVQTMYPSVVVRSQRVANLPMPWDVLTNTYAITEHEGTWKARGRPGEMATSWEKIVMAG